MPSKKQRAKAAKGTNSNLSQVTSMMANMAASSANVRANASSSQGRILDRRPIERGHVSPGDSPFLKKLPREIRDKIYEELLVVRLQPEDQEKYDHAKNATATPYGDWDRENALGFYEQDFGLLPGGTQNYGSRYIGKNKGILLANKQIYEEAITVLFEKNLFLILPEWERVWSFWRCESYGCEPVERPCYVRPETASRIKHIYMVVNNPRLPTDPDIAKDSSNLRKNIHMVADTLRGIDVKLQTLKIQYTSCFRGELDVMRENIEAPVPEGMPKRPIMIQDNRGKYHYYGRDEVQEKLFKLPRIILEPLKGWGKAAEDVTIRGDLASKDIEELQKTLSVDDPGRVALKKQKEETEAKKKREPYKNAGNGLADFARQQLEKNPDASEGMKDMYRRLMRTPAKSPSIMAELCKPPTQEELDRIGAGRQRGRGAQASATNDAANI